MRRGQFKQLVALLVIAALLATIFVPHLLELYPRGHEEVLHVLPVLLTALLFRAAVAIGFAVAARALRGAESWMEATPPLVWGAGLSAIALAALLGIRGTDRTKAR